MQKTVPSSTGGIIRFTPTGLIHTAREGAYSGRFAETNTNPVLPDAPKRGRGRPKKSA